MFTQPGLADVLIHALRDADIVKALFGRPQNLNMTKFAHVHLTGSYSANIRSVLQLSHWILIKFDFCVLWTLHYLAYYNFVNAVITFVSFHWKLLQIFSINNTCVLFSIKKNKLQLCQLLYAANIWSVLYVYFNQAPGTLGALECPVSLFTMFFIIHYLLRFFPL